MPRPARSHARYYVGTDGRITVWRRTLTMIYRSVYITGFSRRFCQTRPSGPNSYPVEQIGEEEWRALVEARGPIKPGQPRESWIDNADLPKDLVLPIPGTTETKVKAFTETAQ